MCKAAGRGPRTVISGFRPASVPVTLGRGPATGARGSWATVGPLASMGQFRAGVWVAGDRSIAAAHRHRPRRFPGGCRRFGTASALAWSNTSRATSSACRRRCLALGKPRVVARPRPPRIDDVIDRIYDPADNGVYRAGFARIQGAYDRAVRELFAALGEFGIDPLGFVRDVTPS